VQESVSGPILEKHIVDPDGPLTEYVIGIIHLIVAVYEFLDGVWNIQSLPDLREVYILLHVTVAITFEASLSSLGVTHHAGLRRILISIYCPEQIIDVKVLNQFHRLIVQLSTLWGVVSLDIHLGPVEYASEIFYLAPQVHRYHTPMGNGLN